MHDPVAAILQGGKEGGGMEEVGGGKRGAGWLRKGTESQEEEKITDN